MYFHGPSRTRWRVPAWMGSLLDPGSSPMWSSVWHSCMVRVKPHGRWKEGQKSPYCQLFLSLGLMIELCHYSQGGHCPGLGHFTRAVWCIDFLSRWVSFPAEKPGGILVWFIVQRFTDVFGNMVVAGTSQHNSRRSQINSVNTSTVFQFSLILLHCMLFSFPLLLSTDLRKMCFKYSLCLSDATGMPEQASGFWLVRTLAESIFVPKSLHQP